MNIVHYTHCPVCNSLRIDPLLTVKDHSVSKEEFEIWQCRECSLRFTQNTPDEDSIGSYYKSEDYISHTNTSRGLINSLYQRVRKHTLSTKSGLVKSYTVPQGNLLDMGAGVGAFLSHMKQEGWEVSGIEPDASARQTAADQFHIHLQDKDAFYNLKPGSFDAITLWHVLEHVHELHPYMEQLKNLLKPGGKIFIAVPNYTSADQDIYKYYWAAYDVPRHLYHFSPDSMKVLVQKHGMKILSRKPMWFDSFYISLLSSRYKRGKPSWVGAVLSGLRSNLNAMVDRERCSSLIYVVGRQ